MPGDLKTIAMPGKTETEIIEIAGRELKIHWNSPRFGEWLAWCYVAAPSNIHHEGAGFEARAPSVDAAKAELLRQVEAHLAKA